MLTLPITLFLILVIFYSVDPFRTSLANGAAFLAISLSAICCCICISCIACCSSAFCESIRFISSSLCLRIFFLIYSVEKYFPKYGSTDATTANLSFKISVSLSSEKYESSLNLYVKLYFIQLGK